ncbi:hypothetical protein MTR_3g023050 [Medicago truncatula]|uniref:Uncharacterized protein n=1 Tax=Medicago truncatula TaxID=3880 RepID=G7J1M9_MEDTR|nr:hypothetical protein MTR_3g023050 [Medicago truncatula]
MALTSEKSGIIHEREREEERLQYGFWRRMMRVLKNHQRAYFLAETILAYTWYVGSSNDSTTSIIRVCLDDQRK